LTQIKQTRGVVLVGRQKADIRQRLALFLTCLKKMTGLSGEIAT
jgi:hypothetical protein